VRGEIITEEQKQTKLDRHAGNSASQTNENIVDHKLTLHDEEGTDHGSSL